MITYSGGFVTFFFMQAFFVQAFFQIHSLPIHRKKAITETALHNGYGNIFTYDDPRMFAMHIFCFKCLQIFLQDLCLICCLPRQIQVITSEMSVCCGLLVDRTS